MVKRRAFQLLVAHVSLLLACGCAFQPRGPAWVPAEIVDAQTGKPIQSAVIVSTVSSTGWFPYLTIESQPHPFKPRIERVTFLDPKNPRAYLPYTVNGGFVLALIINEDAPIAVFAPGYIAGQWKERVLVDGKPVERNDAVYEKGASLRFELSPYPSSSATSQPVEPNWSLFAEPIWDLLRTRYEWGFDRKEIKVICGCALENAEACLKRNLAGFRWDSDQMKIIHWCEQVTSQKLPTTLPACHVGPATSAP